MILTNILLAVIFILLIWIAVLVVYVLGWLKSINNATSVAVKKLEQILSETIRGNKKKKKSSNSEE